MLKREKSPFLCFSERKSLNAAACDGQTMVESETNRDGKSGLSEEWLAKAGELTSILLTESVQVKAFRVRWMVISNRLRELLNSISAITNSPCCDQSGLLRDLLPYIVNTLEDGRELSKKCFQLNYGGKLLMQSNLDALATRLDLHIRDFQLLVKNGVFYKRAVLGTSSFEANSKAERRTAALQVWDLCTRLKIGNGEFKKRALDSLIEYLRKDEKNAILFAEKGDIPSLIRLLDSNVPSIREKATEAVSILAQADACKQSLMTEGAHAPLIRLLEIGSPLAKEKAAEALRGLTHTTEVANAVAAHGGVPALLEICRSGTPRAQAMAAGTIRNLASNENVRPRLAEESAIPVLINMVTSGTPLAQEYATEALQNLSSGEDRLRLVIATQGGIPSLLMYLSRANSPKTQEIAIRALRNLAVSTTSARALISAGYVHQLTSVLKSGSSTVQQLAASAMCNLSSFMDLRKVVVETGCIPPLTKMLEAKNSSDQEAAAKALSTLLLIHDNQKEFCKDEKSISRLVQLLDPRNQSINKRFPISALLALSGSSNWRKRMLSAGARQHLEKLAEMDIAGAKKTLDKIGGSKILSIFNRFKS